jgi:hypothetical protein
MSNWETADVLRSPMEICWQFDYTIESQKLKNLYSKSKRLQWDAERDLDWSQAVDPSKPLLDEGRFRFEQIPFFKKLSQQQMDGFRAHMAAYQLSQFLHGEQGALMTAAALTHAVPDYEGKLYAATQTMDEARHVEVYERYIRKIAIVYPLGEWLKKLIDDTLTASHWVKIAIGMNMVVEGLALGSFHNMRRQTGCNLLRSIVEGVLRDESRHVAFGNVYVGQTIAAMHADEREDVAEFTLGVIRGMWRMQRRGGGGGIFAFDPNMMKVIQNAGIDPADMVRGIMEAREQGIRGDVPTGQVYAFKDLMMPALFRVGAITPRTRAIMEQEGIKLFEDASVLESLEDADTGVVEFAN